MTIHANFGSFFSGKLGNSHTGGDGNRFPQRMKLLLLGSKMFHCHYMCNVVFGRRL